MSAIVPHLRPTMDATDITIGAPVSAETWATLAGLANWCNGHGGMLIPWAAVGASVASGDTRTFPFRVIPKRRAVERIWAVNLRRGDLTNAPATATLALSSPSVSRVVSVDWLISGLRQPVILRHQLTSKASAVETASIAVTAADGPIRVESIAMWEQTRATLALDTTDYGVDLVTTRVRQPIADLPNRSLPGVCDVAQYYDGIQSTGSLDARRPGYFHATTGYPASGTSGTISVTSTTPVDILSVDPLCLAPVSAESIAVIVFAQVNVGSGWITGTGIGDPIEITDTSWAWTGTTVQLSTEDLGVVDGRPSSSWGGTDILAHVDSGTTMNIATVSIIQNGAYPL